MAVCPACGAESLEDARFCPSCGTPLATEEPGRSEVRKTVSVVFSDVTGSAVLGERLDPEALRLYEQKGNLVSAERAESLLAELATA